VETLIAEPSSDYFSVDAARTALEPALHAWKASSELDQGLRFSFKYTGPLCMRWRPASSPVAIDDVVALSDAMQVSWYLASSEARPVAAYGGKRGLRVATPVASTTGRPWAAFRCLLSSWNPSANYLAL
jgi:hypothetical protein